MTEFDDIGDRFRKIFAETDTEKHRALSRRLRCDIWDRLDREDRKKLRDLGIDLSGLKRGLREI